MAMIIWENSALHIGNGKDDDYSRCINICWISKWVNNRIDCTLVAEGIFIFWFGT